MNPTTTRHVLRGLGELVAYVPYLLGFHPSRSIVVLGLREGSIGPVARIDVTADTDEQDELVRLVGAQMGRADPEGFDVLLFGDDQVGRAMVRRLASTLRARAAPVRHVVVVRDATPARPARWQVASCRCPARCARQWRDVPAPDSIPLVADRVLEEEAPARDRAELVASLRPRPLVSRAVWSCLEQGTRTPGAYARALLAVLDVSDQAVPVDRLPPHLLADVLLSWVSRSIRDHAMGWLVPHSMSEVDLHPELTAALRAAGREPAATGSADPVVVNRTRERLRVLVSCAPEPLVPAAATLLACWCWFHGGGALATVALERALEVDPGYRLAQLLMEVVQAGIRPDQMHPTSREEAG